MERTPEDRLQEWLDAFNRRYGREITLHLPRPQSSLTHADVESLMEFHERRTRENGWKEVGPP